MCWYVCVEREYGEVRVGGEEGRGQGEGRERKKERNRNRKRGGALIFFVVIFISYLYVLGACVG